MGPVVGPWVDDGQKRPLKRLSNGRERARDVERFFFWVDGRRWCSPVQLVVRVLGILRRLDAEEGPLSTEDASKFTTTTTIP